MGMIQRGNDTYNCISPRITGMDSSSLRSYGKTEFIRSTAVVLCSVIHS